MAKNLKLNIKNDQLASALNLKGKLKKPAPEKEIKEGVKEKEEGTTISRIIKEPHKEPYTPNPTPTTPPPAPVEEFETQEPHVAAAPEPTPPPVKPDYPQRADAPPRMEYPQRIDHPARGEQQPRGEYTPRSDYTPRNDRPPRSEYTPRTDRPPRSDYTPRTDRPAGADRTPRSDYTPRTDRPPRSDYTPRTDRPPRSDYTPGADRPPRSDYTPRTDRPPRTDYTPRTDHPPRITPPEGTAQAGPKPPPPTFIRTSKGFVRADERGKLPSAKSDGKSERSPFPRKDRPPHAFPRAQEPLPPLAPGATRGAAPRKPSTPGTDFRDNKAQKKGVGGESRGFDARDRQGLRDVESENWRRQKAHQKRRVSQDEQIIRPKAVSVRVPIQIKELAAAMKLKASELVAKLFLQGILVTLNDFLEDETTIQLLGQEFDCEITIDTSEEKRLQITGRTIREEIADTPEEDLIIRPPIITFMGHVDHGKTSLIDTIRKSNVAAGESGAITQHIGAFRCHTPVGDLTILDTPGHEAFSAMRSRGANITDVVALVIAGDEGIRAQTIEAIEQARTAGVPIVVVLNKCDKPNFNPEDVYRQLADQNLLPEAWGGSVVTVNCSATTGQGIDQLLEMLALQSEMLELKANPNSRARGVVIESEMHKGMGSVATLVVQNGTLRIGDAIVFGEYWARIKTMEDEAGKKVAKAGPSAPVKITGLSGIPDAGSEFIAVANEKQAREIAEARGVGQKEKRMQIKTKGVESLLAKHAKAQETKTLNLVLRADVQGSLEALKSSLLKIKSQKVQIYIVSEGVGEISESDIQLAAASKASIVGFHTKIESHAEPLIKDLRVEVTLYDIIYHAVDGVKKLMVSLLDKIPQENTRGKAEVKTVFKSSQLGSIAGCQVIEGTIQRNHRIRQIRNGKEIWKGGIASLKRVKEDVREVNKGYECGILLQNNNEVLEGDILEAFDITYLTQEL